jgi:hypothetical protein
VIKIPRTLGIMKILKFSSLSSWISRLFKFMTFTYELLFKKFWGNGVGLEDALLMPYHMFKLRSFCLCSPSFNSWESSYQFDSQPLFWPFNGVIIINEPLVTRSKFLPKTIVYMWLSFIGLLNIKIIYMCVCVCVCVCVCMFFIL